MSLATFLICVWIILVNISQYFLGWIAFSKAGLEVIGAIGLIGAVLWLFAADKPLEFWKRP